MTPVLHNRTNVVVGSIIIIFDTTFCLRFARRAPQTVDGMSSGHDVDAQAAPSYKSGPRPRRSRSRSLDAGPTRPAKVSKTMITHDADDSSGSLPLVMSIQPPSAYQYASNIAIQKPTQITTFSYDESRTLHHDDRSRRYYHPPPRQADLNRGFERFIERDENVNEHLDSLLTSLMRLDMNNALQSDYARQQAHVITWRGMMTRLCTMLYEGRDGFEMNVMLVGQTLYLEDNESSEANRASKESAKGDERRRRFGYYGYSFESYTCHSWRTWHPGNDTWDGDVNTNVQWCSVVKTRLGPHRLLIGGEVDAVDPHNAEPVEVKTSMQIRNMRDEERFETKMLRFYMQSFLLGVRKVIVGFRDARGLLITHQEMDTLGMPRAVRGKPHAWDPMACLSSAADVLTSIRNYVGVRMSAIHANDPPPTDEAEKSSTYPVFRLTFIPASVTGHKQLSLRQLSPDEILHEVKSGRDIGRVGFLTRDYYDFARQRLPTI